MPLSSPGIFLHILPPGKLFPSNKKPLIQPFTTKIILPNRPNKVHLFFPALTRNSKKGRFKSRPFPYLLEV